MVDEVVRFLAGRALVADLTLGLGGHSAALLEAGVGTVIGVDRDPDAVRTATERLAPYGPRFRAVVGTFSQEPDVGKGSLDGALYDLGLSSMQLERPERGFGYRALGPLDMRMGQGGPSAKELVNEAPEEELGRLIRDLGEERHWRRIAGAIVRARARRPVETTGELARVVAGAVPRGGRNAPHPARRTFQALRIAVNRELEELATSLPRTADLLAPGGRIVVIAYHSLEDRIVKRFFLGEGRLQFLTKRPLRPGEEEVAGNPRARAAKLRAAARAGTDQGVGADQGAG